MQELIDNYGRKIRKLRVSLLDACNFRCFYCMPENQKFMPPKEWLKPEDIYKICRVLVDHGVVQLRLTGGEPTVRPEFQEIVQNLDKLPLEKFGLTSNGFTLSKHLPFLKSTSCQSINISLDSLNADCFNRITRRKAFDAVYKSIMMSRELEFDLKLNILAMRGVNDHEIMDFVAFSEHHAIPIRFLEMMRIGSANKNQKKLFISAQEIIERIMKHRILTPVTTPMDSTSFVFQTDKNGIVGFIASESQPFCGSCSRWRLSARGLLRACLMSDRGIDMKPFLTNHALNPDGELVRLLGMKPTGRLPEIQQTMNQIGG